MFCRISHPCHSTKLNEIMKTLSLVDVTKKQYPRDDKPTIFE
jgi:hypothetical protein